MGVFSIFREPGKKSDPAKVKIPSREAYYETIARRISFAKYALILLSVCFAAFAFTFYGDELTIENFRYMLKFVSFDPVTVGSDGSRVVYDYDAGNLGAVVRGDLAVVNKAGISVYDFNSRRVLKSSFSYADPLVRTSDRIAYINHDIDDAMRAGILTEDDIPPEIAEILGHSHSQRINTLVENMIDNTIATGTLGMQPEIAQAMDRLRTFMFARVYTNPVAKGEETKAKDMLCRLFEYYMRRPEKLPADFLPQLDFDGMERIVCDYIAGMTDRYAVYKYSELFIPTTWQVR